MYKQRLFYLAAIMLVMLLLPACRKYYASDFSDGDSSGYEEEGDYTWNSSQVTPIILQGTSVDVSSANVITDGSTVTIISSGTYSLRGTLSDGQIIINSPDEGIVRIILDSADITCNNSAPVYVRKAGKVIVVLADGTGNTLTDGLYYVQNDGEPSATIYSKSYLAFYGNGSLTVNANFNDGITGKDGLTIRGGTYNITSADDGIRGKDYIIIRSGYITINANGDGMKSDNADDPSLGYITIDSALISISSSGDGINAKTGLTIHDGSFIVKTGGGAGTITVTTGPGGGGGGMLPPGSSGGYSGLVSAKGLKADESVIIEKGTFDINSADDAIHSNNTINIEGGNFSISSGDDAIHADNSLTLTGCIVSIQKCYEGIESALITIGSGDVHVISTDDAVNATKGLVSGGTEANDGSYLDITGGDLVLNTTNGDGLDSNGNIEMSGGTVIVHGPQSQPEVGFDVNGSFNISGGFLIATGPNSGNMIEVPGTASSQSSVEVVVPTLLSSSTLFHIQDEEGNDVVTYQPVRNVYYVVVSSPVFIEGSVFYIYTGGSSTGTNIDGIYTGGSYSGGTLRKSFTITGTITKVTL